MKAVHQKYENGKAMALSHTVGERQRRVKSSRLERQRKETLIIHEVLY